MPSAFHALKWFAVVTVPLVRCVWRTDQYWLNVAVPSIDGSFTRCVS